MLNKIYEWIETSFANLRNGVPAAAEHSDANQATGDGQMRRKRPIEWYEGYRGVITSRRVFKNIHRIRRAPCCFEDTWLIREFIEIDHLNQCNYRYFMC